MGCWTEARLFPKVMRHYDEIEPIILSVDPEDEVRIFSSFPIRLLQLVSLLLHQVSIADVARIISKEMGLRDEQLVFDTTKADETSHRHSFQDEAEADSGRGASSTGQFKKTASNAKLRAHLPDYEFKPIEEGLKEVCGWFRRNYSSARKHLATAHNPTDPTYSSPGMRMCDVQKEFSMRMECFTPNLNSSKLSFRSLFLSHFSKICAALRSACSSSRPVVARTSTFSSSRSM
eukprot:scaffold178_cov255-Pinguiococcus_pyrenoidosus.AAC.14